MMNGKINVNSSPRLGTAVSITIPLTVIQHIRSEQTRPLNVIGFHSKDDTITVLFVDDRSEYRDIVGNYLRDFNVIICATGQEAIDAYKEHRPDIVFLDCFMPIMDGYTVSTKIREYEKETHLKATPIVALTANAVPESEQKTKHSGMNDIMYKPFSKHQLIEKIKVWLRTEAIDRRNQQ
jgi:CheY-like chemotaxis protein